MSPAANELGEGPEVWDSSSGSKRLDGSHGVWFQYSDGKAFALHAWDLDSVPILNLPSTRIKNVSFAADSYAHTNKAIF